MASLVIALTAALITDLRYRTTDSVSNAGGPTASTASAATAASSARSEAEAEAGVAAAEPWSTQRPAAQQTRWRPEAGLSWQWQLSVPVDQTVDAAVYDIDLFENDASVVASLHAAGRKVTCYFEVGSYENFRPDQGAFPASLLGKTNGWPGERWIDIRQIDVLRPIMTARFDLCAQRGFDGVEPDLMDGFSSDTGFPLTAADQLRYNLMIADLGHQRGLAVGLKNDLTQIPLLVTHFEFSVNEQCAEYAECPMLVPFIAAGKPVFHAEYDVPTSAFCEETTALGFSSIRKRIELGAWRETC